MTATMTDTPAGLQQLVFPATVSAGGVYPLNGALTATVNHGYAFTPSSTESGLNFPVPASDRAGNVVTHTFDVERDATAPAVTVNAPGRIYSSTIPVSWTVAELGSGPTGVYTVSVMTDTGPLQPWLNSVTATSANFPGEFGHKYTFVVTTTDNVNNVGQGTAETVATQVTKYYYIGASRVAMRQGDAVTYLHTDHLGTVSVATNQSQVVLARTLNLPYGGVRWTDGTMPTDWGYTGQREPVGTGLVYLHARFYAPFAGRFVSADTIVPEPGNAGDLNRYSYTRNNPLKYIDPTGHFIQCVPLLRYPVCGDDGFSIDNPQWTSNDPEVRQKALLEYNNRLATWAQNGWITDLEAFAQLAEYAVSLNPYQGGTNILSPADNGSQTVIDDLTAVIVPGGSLYEKATHLRQTGFAWIFQDPGAGGEQPGHFWQWVQTAFGISSLQRGIIASLGNVAHETFLTRPDGKGRSYQDYALGKEGVYLGGLLNNGMKIREIGDYIRTNLGPRSPKIGNWIGTPEGEARLRGYAQALAIVGSIFPIPKGEQGNP